MLTSFVFWPIVGKMFSEVCCGRLRGKLIFDGWNRLKRKGLDFSFSIKRCNQDGVTHTSSATKLKARVYA